MDIRKLSQFLEDLTQLSRKHGIVIAGCGCCGSPFLFQKEKEYFEGKKYRPEYITTEGEPQHLILEEN